MSYKSVEWLRNAKRVYLQTFISKRKKNLYINKGIILKKKEILIKY